MTIDCKLWLIVTVLVVLLYQDGPRTNSVLCRNVPASKETVNKRSLTNVNRFKQSNTSSVKNEKNGLSKNTNTFVRSGMTNNISNSVQKSQQIRGGRDNDNGGQRKGVVVDDNDDSDVDDNNDDNDVDDNNDDNDVDDNNDDNDVDKSVVDDEEMSENNGEEMSEENDEEMPEDNYENKSEGDDEEKLKDDDEDTSGLDDEGNDDGNDEDNDGDKDNKDSDEDDEKNQKITISTKHKKYMRNTQLNEDSNNSENEDDDLEVETMTTITLKRSKNTMEFLKTGVKDLKLDLMDFTKQSNKNLLKKVENVIKKKKSQKEMENPNNNITVYMNTIFRKSLPKKRSKKIIDTNELVNMIMKNTLMMLLNRKLV